MSQQEPSQNPNKTKLISRFHTNLSAKQYTYIAQRKRKEHLFIAISVKVLLLNNRTKVEADIVDHIRRVLCQIQHHEIEVQSNNTFPKHKNNKDFINFNHRPLKQKKSQEQKVDR